MAFFSQKKTVSSHEVSDLLRPRFVKPFISDQRALDGLNQKLESAPPESKHIFRDALRAIKIKNQLHEAVYQVISSVPTDCIALYDLQTRCRHGRASSDFVLISNSAIISIDCIIPEQKRTFDETYEDLMSVQHRMYDKVEHGAYILVESLAESRTLPRKILERVYPICVSVDPEDKQVEKFDISIVKSLGYPEVYRATHLHMRELSQALGVIYESNDRIKIPDKKLRSASEYLMDYAKMI